MQCLLACGALSTISESFTPGEPSVVDQTFPDEVGNEAIEEGLNKNTRSQQQTEPQPANIELLKPDEWDKERTYDEDPPSCIHYSIE